MFLISSCSCLCPIHWSQLLIPEWRCSWSSSDRQCSNYIWVINNFIAHYGVTYISYSPETLNLGQNQRFFVLCDLEILWMTLKKNRAPLLCCFKLSASFHSHQLIKTKVTVQKHSIRVKISDFLSRVTFKFDRWPWKTIGHPFYITSSFLHHFIAIGELKLELQSGNG